MSLPLHERSPVLLSFLTELRLLVEQYPRLTHTWRFATSAVWAIDHYHAAYAAHPPTKAISEESFVKDTLENIDALASHNPVSLDWERGFWFNAAIMRLDALWERVFKLFLPPGVDRRGPSLYKLIQARSATLRLPYERSSFGQVRKIVNQLKHEPGGAGSSIREQLDLPVQLLKDFLGLINEPAFRAELARQGKGSVTHGKPARP
ncbi:MAG: hypothetical protein HYX43_08730 [Burkholderiales bacterium]|nr:hypothetical protein [Burkholderiales bacterium]